MARARAARRPARGKRGLRCRQPGAEEQVWRAPQWHGEDELPSEFLPQCVEGWGAGPDAVCSWLLAAVGLTVDVLALVHAIGAAVCMAAV